ncbi:hypothetical protein FLA_6102 [Filimonas lacunae]|nr:hypothetical protein FLA_6102 [Filimonas lacunae]
MIIIGSLPFYGKYVFKSRIIFLKSLFQPLEGCATVAVLAIGKSCSDK